MTPRFPIRAVLLSTLLAAAAAAAPLLAVAPAPDRQSGAAATPQTAPASAPAQPRETLTIAAQMAAQFGVARRQLLALADRMPDEHYQFQPTPQMKPFVQAVAHVAAANFAFCRNLTGQPSPHAGEDLEKTVTTKSAATAALKESFDYCSAFAAKPTAEAMTTPYEAVAVGKDGARAPLPVERGGLFSNLIAHNNEMYGYLSVYLRLKGLVPPSSDPRPAAGRTGGAGLAGELR